MNKKALKKLKPGRNEIFKKLRQYQNLETMVLGNGTEIYVNLSKHFLLKKPYRNKEIEKNMIRKISNYAESVMKTNEIKQEERKEVSADVKIEVNN